jgi:hypothetical protein
MKHFFFWSSLNRLPCLDFAFEVRAGKNRSRFDAEDEEDTEKEHRASRRSSRQGFCGSKSVRAQ